MKTEMPCGYQRTGKLRDHLAHYKSCQHPACKARLAAAQQMGNALAKDLAAQRKGG